MTSETINGTPHIRLQGIGLVKAKPASELQPGDVTWWNYGHPYVVESIEQSGKMLKAVLRKRSNDPVAHETWERRFKPSRLVAVS